MVIAVQHATPTLSRAIGQMMMVGFRGTTVNDQSPVVKAIKNYHIGGVLLLPHEKINGKTVVRNIKDPQQLKKLTQQLQTYANKYHDAPLFIAVNQEGGLINALKTKDGFNVGKNYSEAKLGQLNNPKLAYQQALARGRLLKKSGINLNFAPVADLNINPNNPGIGKLQRSYSKNPQIATRFLQASISAYHQSKIFCTLKHFPGLGSATANTDFGVADVTKTRSKKELIPYQKLINNNQACTFVMVTHLINRKLDASGLQASLSRKIEINLLRHKLHFKGLIITDDMDAAAIRNHVPAQKAIKLAVLAGNNIILYGGTQGYDPAQDTKMLFNTLLKLGEKNPKVRRRIFQSYRKILNIKLTK